uniref:C2H2-type domain-containing protein n=1 Tax=Hucho hucho TaxID=62062 RepID=A0A4W5M423_9TELE
MSEKKAALARMMMEEEEDDGWVSNYCSNATKEPCRSWTADLPERVQTKHVETKPVQAKPVQTKPTQKHVQIKPFHQVTAPKRRFQKEEKNHVSTAPVAAKRVKGQRSENTTVVEPQPVNHVMAKAKTEKLAEPLAVEEQPVIKRRGRKPGPQPGPRSPVKTTESSADTTTSVRRSFRQLDMAQENLARQVGHRPHRHMTRLSEKKPPKRRGRKPRWLLEGTFQAENSAPRKARQPGRKPPQQRANKTSQSGVKETKQKNAVTSQNKMAAARLTAPREQEGKRQKEIPATNHLPAVSPAHDSKLEISLPDNEVFGHFHEDYLSRQGPVTLNCYTSKASTQAQYRVKNRLGEESILSAQNASLFTQQLHNYAQTPKAQGVTLNTETCLLKAIDVRPSLNQSCLPVPWDASGVFYQTSGVEMEVEVSSQTVTATATDMTFTPQGGAVEHIESPMNEDGFSTDVRKTCRSSVPSVNATVPNNTGRRTNTDVTNVSREPAEVTNIPKKHTASEVGDIFLKSSGKSEVTDILKEAMDIANIGVDEAMMGDGDTGSVPGKETRELAVLTPFCWLANTSMEAFAREFEKFANGPDSDVVENQESVIPQTTDNVSHNTLETTPSTSPKVILKAITDPVVLEDTSKVTEVSPQDTTDIMENMDTPHTQKDTQLDIKGTSQNMEPQDNPMATESFPQLTDETRQLEHPLKGTVATPEVSVDSTQDNDTPQITKDPPQNTQDIGQLTEDTLKVIFTEVPPQATEDRTKATVDTPEAVDTLPQNTEEDSSEVIEEARKVTETPQKVTVDTSKHIEDAPQIRNTADTLQGKPQLTVDVPMVGEELTKDTRGATQSNGDTPQGKPQLHEDTPQGKPQLHEDPPQGKPQLHEDTLQGKPQLHEDTLQDTPVTEDTPRVPDETSQEPKDTSKVSGDTPMVSEVTPQGTQYNSQVNANVTESAHTPKVTPRVPEDTSQDPKDASNVTENSTQKTRDTPKFTKDTPTVSGDFVQNPGDGTPQENENSPLAYSCSLCNKVFKGKRVIAHAMYHFRRDQCMFCRMLFKNDLLAMMHLSQHIDKLKKGNVPPDIEEVRENCTAGMSDTPGRSTQRGRRGRKRISVNSTESTPPEYRKLRSTNRISINSSESTPPDRRKLRSNPKLRSSNRLSTDSQPSPETKLTTEESEVKPSTQRVNGQRGRRRVKVEGTEGDGDTQEEEQEKISRRQEEERSALEQREEPVEISTSPVKTSTREQGGTTSSPLTRTLEEEEKPMEDNTESPAVSVTQDRLSVSPSLETSVQGKETPGSCPVDGCPEIFTGKLSCLLGHILDDHRGDAKLLETTFRHGNGKCNICKKPGLTLRHYQHHIVWHRGSPRHPCLHYGCKARFSAATEMRNHTKTHQPLQAVCCFPGCQERLACLPELNRHEREHYRLPKAGKDESVFATLVTNTAAVKMIKRCKTRNKLQKMQGRWPLREKEASAADLTTTTTTTTVKVTKKYNLTKTLKKTQDIERPRVHRDKDPRTTDPSTISVKVTKKLKRSQVNRKPCVGKKMNASTTPVVAVAEKASKKLKIIHKVNKAWPVKRQNVSIDNYSPTGPSASSTTITQTEKVTKKLQIINKLKKMRVIKKPNVSEEKETQPGPATDTKETNKSTVTDELKKTQVVKTQSVIKDLEKTSKKPVKLKTSGPEKHVSKDTEVLGSKDTEVLGSKSKEEDDKPLVETSDSIVSGVCDQKMLNGHLKDVTKESPKYQKSLKTSTVSKSKKCEPRNHEPATPKTPTNTPRTPTNTPRTPTNTPRTPIKEEAKNTTFFGKINNRPYIRPPPTAYLDERYTTMPKRRKEMSWTPHLSPTRPDLVGAASGSTATPLVHRQRCAKCFLSFASGEELRTHLTLKKCTALFGFDSDEESNG